MLLISYDKSFYSFGNTTNLVGGLAVSELNSRKASYTFLSIYYLFGKCNTECYPLTPFKMDMDCSMPAKEFGNG